MELKIDIVKNNVFISIGKDVVLTLSNVSEVNVKHFRKIQEDDTVYKYADSSIYGLISGITAGSGGVTEQPYGYELNDNGEIVKIP